MTSEEHIQQAIALHRNGELEKAEEAYRMVLQLDPDNATATHLLGAIRHQKRDLAVAEELYRRAVRIQPRYLQAWTNLGMLLQDQERWSEALECLRAAVALEPSSPSTWVAMGRLLSRAGDLAGAEDAYRQAIFHDPNGAESYNNLGTVLAREGDATGARASFEMAAAKKAGYISPMTNLAKLLREQGRLEEAAAMYERALALNPTAAAAHWGLAHVLLLRGEFLRGWEEYEWRWALEERPRVPDPKEPRWNGEACKGKQLIVAAEQGLGDAIQFVRYVPVAAELGGRVTLIVPATLVRLFRDIPGAAVVTSEDSASIVGDYHCPLLSLPRAFRTTLDSIPSNVPYLRTPEPVRQFWEDRCGRVTSGLKVGVAWAGSSTHENDSRRSLDPDFLRRLQSLQGIQLYSLQVSDAQNERRFSAPPSGLIDHTHLFHDVADTAGLIQQLDLVVTVDTMVAHLAGALGKPVWILLPKAPDWRWLLDCDTSPWYPSARIVRQTQEGKWDDVIEKVCAMLKTELQTQPNKTELPLSGPADLEAAIRDHEEGRVAKAEIQYRAALQADPFNAEVRYLLAVARSQQQDYREAIALGRQLVQSHPFFPEPYNALGNSLRRNGDLIGAEDVLRKAITLRPNFTDAHYNLGSCLCDAWRLDEAADEFLSTLRLDPHYIKALNNLGLVRYRQGRIAEAIQYYKGALADGGTLPEIHWNLSHALLHTEAFAEGWKEFEWRWQLQGFQSLKERLPGPRWQGEDIRGRRLLIWAEQGFGDVLMFVRILPMLHDLGAEILFECPTDLAPLLERQHGIAVLKRGELLPEFDVHCPLLSLPAVVGWGNIPTMVAPYINPNADLCMCWEEELAAAGDRIRVGIAWSGSTTNSEGRFRSIPMSVFAGLGCPSNVFFVNLQKGGSGEFARSPFSTDSSDWTDRLVDFDKTAALIKQLDLVITVDTAVAHLAGAMGKQVWVLLAKACDWRWGSKEASTSWYPSARMYRQRKQGEWGDVVDEVRHDLTLLASQIQVPWCVREDPPVRERMTHFDPGSFASWNNLGVALLDAGAPRGAIAPLEQAVALEPENPRAHLNLGFAQLADGQWKEGLENHEWRLKTEEGSSSHRPYAQPRWMGQPLRGKNVFLYAEQGFGDAIQCIRYAWLFAQTGARVSVEVRPPLVRLMQHAPGISSVIVRGEEPPPFDYHSPLLSLPYAFRTTPSSVPARMPYLIAGHQQLVEWKKLLDGCGNALRIGVCWSGNARFIHDARRSISAEMLCETLRPFEATLVPLVKENSPLCRPENVEETRWCDLTGRIQDFEDTAALISYLDLVVTVDTAVAHLAGALGKPVFTLLPSAPDWRWLNSGDTTPWYPTMRLFRQTQPGSWKDPLNILTKEVAEFLKRRAEQSQKVVDDTWELDG
jgi:Flp pilus assembly protein TadD/ADP-heptose:LPS heptosyltransferase